MRPINPRSMKLPLARPRPSRWHRARHVARAAGLVVAGMVCAVLSLIIVAGVL